MQSKELLHVQYDALMEYTAATGALLYVGVMVTAVQDKIQDSQSSTHHCFPKYSPNQKSLEERIRLKGPGILDLTTTPDPVTILQKFEKSVTKSAQKEGAKDFDMEIEALFNKL